VYCASPGDIDLLVRAIPIKIPTGSEIVVVGPSEGDHYKIQSSPYHREDEGEKKDSNLVVRFKIQGALENNILERLSSPVSLKRNTLSDAMIARPYAFFIYIEEVEVERVYIAIARRRIVPEGHYSHNTSVGLRQYNEKIPDWYQSSILKTCE
jgi:hypothetical protein